jgi:hypothetical protein
MPDPQRLLRTLRQAADAFRTTPGRRGRFVQLTGADEVLVAGDLHGDLENFKRLLRLADLGRHPRRHFVLQELLHGPYRYPGGGDQSHRLLDVVAALKCQYPDRVHVLMGNHELSQWTNRAIMKGDEDLLQLFRQGVETAYDEQAAAVYAAYEELFAVMPFALRTPNRVFLSHSVPSRQRLDAWELAMLCQDEHGPDAHKLGGCLHAVVWGRDVSAETVQRYLQKVDADLLISGHIPCSTGYHVPNPYQLILDCKDEQACCCLFPADRALTQADLLAGVRRLYPELGEAQGADADST